MRSVKLLISVGLSLFIQGCVSESLTIPDDVQDRSESVSEAMYVDGVANVLFSEETALLLEEACSSGSVRTRSSDIDVVFDALEVTSFRRLFPYAANYEERTRKSGLHRWYRITYAASSTMTKAQDCFFSLPGVEEFCPERKIEIRSVFNDPGLAVQWHYFNDGSMSSDFRSGADINVMPVWETFTKGRREVIVAVVDEGVDHTHEDLAANYVDGKNFASGGKVTPGDHGCHVAGTIAAVNNNALGGCGIAGGDAAAGIDGVGILSCQIFSGNLPVGGAEAIKWAADNGAVIANNSWGYSFETEEDARNAKISGDLKAAIDYFIRYAGCDENGDQRSDSPMKGGVVFFASGNDGWKYDPIGQYDPVISVGSIGPDFAKANYSNYGDWVDIAAPGGNLKFNRGGVYSSLTGNGYGYMQGTSMACPHVSGVAALLVSYFGGPGFTNDMLLARLFDGARYDVLSPTFKIGPLLDAMGAFTAGGSIAPEAVTDFSCDVVGNKVTVELQVTSDEDDVKAFGYLVLVSEDRALLENLEPGEIPKGVMQNRFNVGAVGVGENLGMQLTGLDFDREYHAVVVGFDYSMNYSALSPIRTFNTGKNNPPVLLCEDEMTGVVLKAHESVELSFSASDPEGDPVSVTLKEPLRGVSVRNVADDKWLLSLSGRSAGTGRHAGELIVSDIHGESVSFDFDFEVQANNPPVVVKAVDDLYLEGIVDPVVLDLSQYIADPDGESLSYKVTEGNRMVAKAVLDGTMLEISFSGYGSALVTVTASDMFGLNCTMSIRIMVKDPANLVEMYPVPVKDFLNVRTGKAAETRVRIISSSGKAVYDESSVISAFEPASIDMSGCAPGMYEVIVEIGSDRTERTIAKI